MPITEDSSFKALEYAIDDKRISNIGITGNYGSGKSSFLLSFFYHKNLEEKCLNVSLASFSLNGDSSENKKVINETEIELDNENIIVSRIKGINSEVESIKSDDKQNI